MNNELIPSNFVEDVDFADQLIKERKVSYCSMEAKTLEEQAFLYNAVSNPTDRIADHINETLMVKDVYCETVECVRAETGETNICPRIVLITEDGKTYTAVSNGVFGAVKRLMERFGAPTWVPALPIKVKQINKADRKILTFEVDITKLGNTIESTGKVKK